MSKSTADSIRTFLMAGMAGGLLFSAVSAYAVTAHQPAPPRPKQAFDSYLREDDSIGALRRDLLARQAQGQNASALLAWMRQGGFWCDVNLAEPGNYDCTYRKPLVFDRVAELNVRIVTRGTLLADVTPVPAPDTANTASLGNGQTGG